MGFEWVARMKGTFCDNDYSANYYECYNKNKMNTNYHCDFNYAGIIKRPATTDEITHFMGLHAERLGMKEGVKVDRSGLSSVDSLRLDNVETLYYSGLTTLYDDGCFMYMGRHVRDSQGNWATVVKEPLVIGGKEIGYALHGDSVSWKSSQKLALGDNMPFTKKHMIAICELLPHVKELQQILDGFPK